jgi:hypothetical protein
MAKTEIGYGKLAAAGSIGGIATAIVALLEHLTSLKLDPQSVAAVQTIITAGAVWFIPHTIRHKRIRAHPHANGGHARHRA